MTTTMETRCAQALHELPHLIAELRAHREPGKTGEQGRRTIKATNTSAPARLATICDADDAYARLHEHAQAIADMLATTAPKVPIYRNPQRDLGLPSNIGAIEAARHAHTLAKFIHHQLPQTRDDDIIHDIQADITTTWQRLTRRYPHEAPPEHVDARCAACHRLTIHKHPPHEPQADETYICAACGKWHTEHELLERIAARQRELKARKTRKGAA